MWHFRILVVSLKACLQLTATKVNPCRVQLHNCYVLEFILTRKNLWENRWLICFFSDLPWQDLLYQSLFIQNTNHYAWWITKLSPSWDKTGCFTFDYLKVTKKVHVIRFIWQTWNREGLLGNIRVIYEIYCSHFGPCSSQLKVEVL